MNPLPADAIPTLTDILEAGKSPRLPTLTDVLIPAPIGAMHPNTTASTPSVSGAVSGPIPAQETSSVTWDINPLPAPAETPEHPEPLGPSSSHREALEARLLQHLSERFQATLETRVHTSVAPAVSMLADRIAYKAAQEVAADLAARMQDDLRLAIRQALDALDEDSTR